MPDASCAPLAFCLTIGDVTGIGPEITAKFLHELTAQPQETLPHLIVWGDIEHLAQTAAALDLTLPQGPAFQYRHLRQNRADLPGDLSYRSLQAAVGVIHAGEAHGLITGPISKAQLEAADIPYAGHTEILQTLARQYYGQLYQSDMLFLHRNFRMLLLTRHVPLRKVSESLSIPAVARSLDNLVAFFQQYGGIQHPRLCVLGVNPHAGESEGQEEERVLLPALKLVSRKYGFGIEPPVAADAAFRQFNPERLPYDAYVAAYHDQGLIPFKMVAGLSAVNVTIGLPFLRTSVSHGTAPDIVGQGIADPCSLREAYRTLLQLTQAPPLLSGSPVRKTLMAVP